MSTPPNARFYVDENLDGRFAEALIASGIAVVRCRQLGLGGVADAVWIPYVTRLGLVVVTGDRLIRYRTVEKAALRSSGSRVLFIRVGKVSHDDLARSFIDSVQVIERFITRHEAPWLVTLARPAILGRPGKLYRLDLGK